MYFRIYLALNWVVFKMQFSMIEVTNSSFIISGGISRLGRFYSVVSHVLIGCVVLHHYTHQHVGRIMMALFNYSDLVGRSKTLGLSSLWIDNDKDSVDTLLKELSRFLFETIAYAGLLFWDFENLLCLYSLYCDAVYIYC